MLFFKKSNQNNDPVTDSIVRCWTRRKREQYIPQPERRETEDQLAYNPIAIGKFLRWNDTNRKPFASILYKFLLVMLCAAVRKGCGFANEMAKG